MRRLLPLLFAVALPAFAAEPLATLSEQSGFTRTGRYQEVIELCDAFAARFPRSVRCLDFGTTPQGRPMKALVASTAGALDPATARRRGLPVVLVQGGIHAGEIDGKDAGFLALREVLEGEAAAGALDKQVLVFVPVFNVDGHERFGAWNRPNQRGPVEMGWRTTAQNHNLNRDYLKADSPEMQAMLALVEAWDPLAVVDLHATNGAQFEHDIAIQVEPVHAGPAALRAADDAKGGFIRTRLGCTSAPRRSSMNSASCAVIDAPGERTCRSTDPRNPSSSLACTRGTALPRCLRSERSAVRIRLPVPAEGSSTSSLGISPQARAASQASRGGVANCCHSICSSLRLVWVGTRASRPQKN